MLGRVVRYTLVCRKYLAGVLQHERVTCMIALMKDLEQLCLSKKLLTDVTKHYDPRNINQSYTSQRIFRKRNLVRDTVVLRYYHSKVTSYAWQAELLLYST